MTPGINETDIKKDKYSSIIDYIQQDAKINDRLDASFHFVKYHDGSDRESDLLNILRSNLVYYCFPKERYKGKSPSEITDLVFEGREKFFNPKNSKNGRSGASRSGELGEIALYFLLESFLNAPQIVSKMTLKTTQGENYKGADGIHVGIHNSKNCVFYCESKINKKRDAALKDCIKSVVEFQKNKKDFEVSIIKNHIDVSDEKLRKAIIEFLDPTKSKSDDWIEIHACFIGFNWNKFDIIERETDKDKLIDKLKSELNSEITAVKAYLEKEIPVSKIKHRFYFFVMPFKDVEALRANFLKLLYGK